MKARILAKSQTYEILECVIKVINFIEYLISTGLIT